MFIYGTVTITKGFQVWKDMVDSSKKEMEKVGIKMLFAATEASDDTQLHIIMEVESMEIAKQISTDPEVIERRRSAGVLVETTKMVPLSEPRIDMQRNAHGG